MKHSVMVVMLSVVGMVEASPAQTPQDDVLRPVQALFDAMRAKDSTAIRTAFAPHARLVRVARGSDTVAVTDADDFARLIATLEPTVDERIWDWTIHVDQNLASVWTKYDVLIDGQFSHCGIDAFQLLKLGDGWKIVHVADTVRRENCWRYEERM